MKLVLPFRPASHAHQRLSLSKGVIFLVFCTVIVVILINGMNFEKVPVAQLMVDDVAFRHGTPTPIRKITRSSPRPVARRVEESSRAQKAATVRQSHGNRNVLVGPNASKSGRLDGATRGAAGDRRTPAIFQETPRPPNFMYAGRGRPVIPAFGYHNEVIRFDDEDERQKATAQSSGSSLEEQIDFTALSELERQRLPPLLQLERNLSAAAQFQKQKLQGEYGWRFVRYVSSDIELEWQSKVKRVERFWSFEDIFSDFAARFDRMVKETAQHAYLDITPEEEMNEECKSALGSRSPKSYACRGDAIGLNTSLWSRFEYMFDCLSPPCDPSSLESLEGHPAIGETHVSFIEPLIGMLRHPLNNLYLTLPPLRTVVNKDYMLVDRWALQNLGTRWRHHPQTSLFFDLGASTYQSGLGGASQSWFDRLSQCMCVPFRDMWLWEMTLHHPSKVFDEVPGHLKQGYHWFNVPLSTSAASWDNPLNHLLSRSKANEDVVITKIDFDDFYYEQQIIDTILKVTEVADRIDELFFEYHVVQFWISWHWDYTMDRTKFSTDSIKLFQRLRHKGIRAHSWV